MCMLVCVCRNKCGLGGEGRVFHTHCTQTVLKGMFPPSPSHLLQRESSFIMVSIVGGRILPVELFRVIILPPSVFTNRALSPPSSFCPDRSLGLCGETACSSGLGVRHHYCQHVCLSWRQRVAWLSVARCRPALFWKCRKNRNIQSNHRQANFTSTGTDMHECHLGLIMHVSLTHICTAEASVIKSTTPPLVAVFFGICFFSFCELTEYSS